MNNSPEKDAGSLRGAARRASTSLEARLQRRAAERTLGLGADDELFRDLVSDRRKIKDDIRREEPSFNLPGVKIQTSNPFPLAPASKLGGAPIPATRRVSQPSADFDRIVGKWMHEAHSRLKQQGAKASRGRKTPTLPTEQYQKIVERTDRARKNGKAQFPLKDVLSENGWRPIADYNTKAGAAKKKLSQWRDVAFKPQFKRAVRYRYNRAEIYYRRHVVPQQS